MTCMGCVAKVKSQFESHSEITSAHIDLEKKAAVLTMTRPLEVHELQTILGNGGKYNIDSIDTPLFSKEEQSNLSTYKPLVLIFLFIAGITTIVSFEDGRLDHTLWMRYFMAGFFIVFSFFKFLDLRGFVDSYMMYDVVAKRIRGYGFIYPFIELGLGLAYLINFEPRITYITTIVVMAVGSIGVVNSVISKRAIKCACLGAVFNLPMSTVTIIENSLMIVMAAFMLWMV